MWIDAPYFLIIIFIILFFIIVHQMVTTVSCVDTGVLIWIVILFFIMVTLINSFLARILSSLSDRMHSIHPHGVVVFSPLLSAFNLINNNDVIFTMESSSQWCHLQKWLQWFHLLMRAPFHGYCEPTVHPLVWLSHVLHVWCRGWAATSFSSVFSFLSLLPQTLCQNWHITTLLHFLLLTSAPLILQWNRHINAASPFLLSHHLLPLIDMLSLHLQFIIIFYTSRHVFCCIIILSSSFSASPEVSIVTPFLSWWSNSLILFSPHCHYLFLQGSWNNTNVIFSPIFIFSSLSYL